MAPTAPGMRASAQSSCRRFCAGVLAGEQRVRAGIVQRIALRLHRDRNQDLVPARAGGGQQRVGRHRIGREGEIDGGRQLVDRDRAVGGGDAEAAHHQRDPRPAAGCRRQRGIDLHRRPPVGGDARQHHARLAGGRLQQGGVGRGNGRVGPGGGADRGAGPSRARGDRRDLRVGRGSRRRCGGPGRPAATAARRRPEHLQRRRPAASGDQKCRPEPEQGGQRRRPPPGWRRRPAGRVARARASAARPSLRGHRTHHDQRLLQLEVGAPACSRRTWASSPAAWPGCHARSRGRSVRGGGARRCRPRW